MIPGLHQIKKQKQKIESIKTINFFSMGHRFGVSENWGETKGKLKFGFAHGRVQTFVLCMPFRAIITKIKLSAML